MEQALSFIQESVDSPLFKEKIADPIMNRISSPSVAKRYIEYGDVFLERNAQALAKPYPTRVVSYPTKYVDDIEALFGYKGNELKNLVISIIHDIHGPTDRFATIKESPTNMIHTVVLHYSDIVQHRRLRDSARQQLALTIWGHVYDKYWRSTPELNEGLMAYTYSKLNRTYDLVNDENVMNWIIRTTEGAYGLYRTKLDLDFTASTVIDFLNETRNRFNQKTKGIANLYYDFRDKGVYIGDDVPAGEDYVDTNAYSNVRSSLMRLIKNKDKSYWAKGDLYKGVARWKNVDVDTLYDFAMKVSMDEISNIMDLIFYVFLVKEKHPISDINTNKFITRITNLPTAIDRCIPGKPVIRPMMKKYDASEIIVRTYICLIAAYIMDHINDINEN